MATQFDEQEIEESFDADLYEDAWDWLERNHPRLSDKMKLLLKAGWTPERVHKHVVRRLGVDRDGLAKRCENSLRYLLWSKKMSDADLDSAILNSIWARLQWDFLVQNPQLSDWLEGSKLEATDEPNEYRLVVSDTATSGWLQAHTFAIRRSLSVELKRPVVVHVVAREAVNESVT